MSFSEPLDFLPESQVDKAPRASGTRVRLRSCREKGFSRRSEIYRDEWCSSLPATNEVGMTNMSTSLLVAMSFHRLFLGGLLPSRARFRFAGRADDYHLKPSGRNSRQPLRVWAWLRLATRRDL
jgi:hypothetical protein